MFGLLVVLVVVGTTVWVGIDAQGRDWPEGSSGTTTWVVGCLLLWIIVFPFYLVRRSKAHPKGSAATASAVAMYRECPHCKEAMRRDAAVCPRCRLESPAWTLHDGHWWFRADETMPWQWFDERTGRWLMNEPLTTVGPTVVT